MPDFQYYEYPLRSSPVLMVVVVVRVVGHLHFRSRSHFRKIMICFPVGFLVLIRAIALYTAVRYVLIWNQYFHYRRHCLLGLVSVSNQYLALQY